jgi:hypothetical protein
MIMKKLLYILLSSYLLIGCRKNFDELRKNPNKVEDAVPGSFLAPILYNEVVTNVSRAYRMGNELMQYTVHKGSGSDFHRYYYTPGEADYFWDRHWQAAFNVQDMYNRAVALGDKNYQGVALTLKAWIFSQLTDIFGDIPYSDALKGDSLLTPKYDEQKDIYTDLLARLDSAANLFGSSGTLTGGADIMYAGDVLKWKKFCNSLRLRLYLRVSKRPEMNSAEKINEIVSNPNKYPIFTSNADQASLYFTNSEPFYNPFYNSKDIYFEDVKAPSVFILGILEERADPRIDKWYVKKNGDYIGVESGYARAKNGEVFSRVTSNIQDTLNKSSRIGTILSYAEVQFILAEAQWRGWIKTGTSTQTYYENGIKASMDFWGAAMPAGFLSGPNVLFDNQLATIMLQKYLALWFTGLEAWYEFRRTGLPELPVNPEALNGGKMPVRITYPTSTQLLNNSHYLEAINRIGGDDPNIRCWWER